MKHTYVIGAGGVGSWLTPALCLLVGKENITVIDGDILERKNLNRQLFTLADIGKTKAEALAEKYGCQFKSEFYSHGQFGLDEDDILIVAVDNNPARASALESCDAFQCCALFGANEVTSAEAYFYQPEWVGKKCDPRIYYPDILTDLSADPRSAAIGCTGEAQVNNRQLVTANLLAAALIGHLYVAWFIEGAKLKPTIRNQHTPYKVVQNLSGNLTFKVADLEKEEVHA